MERWMADSRAAQLVEMWATELDLGSDVMLVLVWVNWLALVWAN